MNGIKLFLLFVLSLCVFAIISMLKNTLPSSAWMITGNICGIVIVAAVAIFSIVVIADDDAR